MDAIGWAIVGVVLVAILAIVVMARRRAWNADGSDDRRRTGPDEPSPDPPPKPRK